MFQIKQDCLILNPAPPQVLLDIIWATGLFEGEGCISIISQVGYRHTPEYKRVSLTLTMGDHDVVERFHTVVGCGHLYLVKRQQEHWKQMLSWQSTQNDNNELILMHMMPHFGSRRSEKAKEALEVIRTSYRRITPIGQYGHGTSSMYTAKKCRCDECKFWKREYMAEYRARKRQEVESSDVDQINTTPSPSASV